MQKNENTNEQIIQKQKGRKKSTEFRSENRTIKRLKRILLAMLIFLILLYIILRIVYETGRFTIELDNASNMKEALVMYESKDNKLTRKTLYADSKDFITNISGDWIPENIDNESDGPHNGNNYIAYTFYVENEGDEVINYWYKIVIDDVIKNVDEAIRVAVYLNGEKQVYAKANKATGQPEKDTIAFKDTEKLFLNERELFNSGDIDKFTIVIWVEGDDPDCIDNLIGGEMKMHMVITEEHIKQE